MKEKTRNKGIFYLMITILIFFNSCSFFQTISEDDNDDRRIEITSLSLSKTSLTTKVGEMEYLSVSVKPAASQKDVKLEWSYDSSVVECDTESSWGLTLKAIAEGKTTLKCSYGGYEATCIVTVQGYSETYTPVTEPYIYSNYTILQTSPGISEKVFVSLYGGDASDIDGYTWTIDNPLVASIKSTGQYCIISAKEGGYARIKITHNKAAFPYYIGVYVFEDATNISYITTSSNIVTVNQSDGDKQISVSLVNGKESSSDSSFVWEVIKENEGGSPLLLSSNGNSAIITPKESGNCTIRVTHPDAPYPLDILCRIITVVQNVYIQPDNTVITLSGENEVTVKSSLINIDEGQYDFDGFSYSLDNYSSAKILNYVGNQVTLLGTANGSCKLIISHEKAAYSREVLVIVNGQLKDAVDASCFITTGQNYIRTKQGDPGQTINISLKGGEEGDESDFQWSVKSTAKDGSNSKVIELDTATGSVFHSRSAAASYSYGQAYLEPLAEGTAVITVTHPKIAYPTEILVKVLNKNAVLDEPLYFSGNGLVKILNGQSQEYKVELKGASKIAGDEQKINWNCDSDYLTVSASADVADIKAPPLETGCTMSYITISHPKADASKKVLVMTADDSDTLNAMKALYSDKTYYNIEKAQSESCYVSTAGFEDGYDFSKMNWTVKDPSVISIEKSSFNPLACKITGLKSGTTQLKASIESLECTFSITVYPEGTVNITPEVYLTTSQNVVSMKGAKSTANINITAVNLSSSEYQNISWTSSDSSVVEVIGNGTGATLTALNEGEAVISVKHKDSQNELKIYVRVGSEYIIKETDPAVYISSTDVLTFLKGGASQSIQAVLANYNGNDTSGFSFTIDDTSVAQISAQTPSGIAYIKPVGSGQAQVTITHPAAEISKKVLVVVGNSAEELEGYVYLTTSSNVVAVGEGNTKSVSVSVKNASSAVLDGYTWLSSNPSVIDITDAGATAVLKGNSTGTALITVKNKICQYPLTIIAQCVDPVTASKNPYIQLSSSVMTMNVGPGFTNVTADLIGGSADDYSGFVWDVEDKSVCAVYGQNEVGKIKALKAGMTYVTVSHEKAIHKAQILVVCEEVLESECYISVPSSIITVKPNASPQTVTASLVNGTATDKYSFNWSLDVYDVIDLQYSCNICTITPKQTGTATITISHPKSAFNQQIIVNVQEYSNFAFPQTSQTVTQGSVNFLNMQIPNTTVTSHVEYSVDNPEICSISGTKAVAQITGIKNGSTTVRAKLVASGTGVVQAESEMLIYVKEAPVNSVFITSSSTIFTVNKGKSQTLSATLSGSGITTSDQYNLKWKTNDTDIISIAGISGDGTVQGQSIYITANKPGEALITCSHDKAASDLQFYVVVPGTAEKLVTLNKTYITLTKGSSGTTLKANIENAESSADYYDLEWNADKVNGNEIVRIMGNGQSVTVYPVGTGETTVSAQLPSTNKIAKCTVKVEAGKSLAFESSSKKVQPFHSKTIKYTVSPPDAVLTWTMAQEDDYFEFHDLGCDTEGNGSVEISGIKEGTGTLACVTDGSAKAQCTVKVAWDYVFTVDTTRISGSPDSSYTVEYTVSPADSLVEISGNGLCEFSCTNDGQGNGKIKIYPKSEGSDSIILKAKNPYNHNEEIGSYVITGKFYYDTLTLSYKKQADVSYANNNLTAYWSKFENDSIILGDGEIMTFCFNVKESKLSDLSISAALQSKRDSKIALTKGSADGQFILSHNTDFTEAAYKIITGYKPTYKGKTSYPDGTPIKLSDFYNTTGLDCDWYYDWGNHYDRKGWWTMRNSATSSVVYEFNSGWMHATSRTCTVANKSSVNSDWGITRDPSLDGKCMSVQEFQSNLWYYIPAFTIDLNGECTSHYRHEYGEIDTDHIKAEYYPVTTDTAVVSSNQADVLVVTISHNGTTSKKYYPIYVETRNSACTTK